MLGTAETAGLAAPVSGESTVVDEIVTEEMPAMRRILSKDAAALSGSTGELASLRVAAAEVGFRTMEQCLPQLTSSLACR